MAQIPPVIGGDAGKLKLTDADLRLLLPIALGNWFYVQWSDGRRVFPVCIVRGHRRWALSTSMFGSVFSARGLGVQ